MVVQVVGYRFNADQMIRLTKGVQGADVTSIEHAWAHLIEPFDNHPDRYSLHLIYADPVAPHFEDVNVIFIIFANYKSKPMPFSICRRLPRFAQATEYLKAHGISEVDGLKLIRHYF